MRTLLATLGIAFLVPFVSHAQTSSKAVVAVESVGPTQPVAAGGTFDATVTLRIKAGYHVNAQKPSEDYLIGTSLETTPPTGLTVTKTQYPPAKQETFSFSETPLAVYSGVAVIKLTVKVAASAAVGPTAIPGKVRFQSCNDSQCLPPSTVDVSIPVEIAAGAADTAGFTLTGTPPNAAVYVDGKPVGRSNAAGRFDGKDLKPGRYRVRVEGDGFEPWEQSVSVAADKPAIVSVAAVATTAQAQPTAAVETSTPPAPTPAPAAATPPAEAPRSNMPLYVVGGVVLVALAALGFVASRRSKRI
jgi:hypothetical protein